MSYKSPAKEPIKIVKGAECLLNFVDRYFKSRILEVGPDTFRVTFPGKDYPVPGLNIVLEFHDDLGFYYIPTLVVEGPQEQPGGITLKKTAEVKRSTHRDSFRVPTDLTVHVRDHIHVRRYDAALVNISGGGALLRSDAPWDFSSTLEITLSLPGESLYTLLGEVMHIAASPHGGQLPERVFGVKFIGMDPEIERAITRYIFARLPELYG
ncbi:MAG TPA: PilZ domain-containing protein [Candidatus Bathyarchaeia archaeon]|nr:PilZ domain-containing protein [Candidatus Bathyarchaeia archaeon]